MNDLTRAIQMLRGGLDIEQIAAVLDTDSATVFAVLEGTGSLPAPPSGGGAATDSLNLSNVVVPHTATAASPADVGSPIATTVGHYIHGFLEIEVAGTPGSTDVLMLGMFGAHGTSFGIFGSFGPMGYPPLAINGNSFADVSGIMSSFDDIITAPGDIQIKAWVDNGSGGAGSTDATLSALRLVVTDFGLIP